MGWSDKVRQMAISEYVEPARRHRTQVVIPVGELQRKLRKEGFPSGHIRQICTSLESKVFTERVGLTLESRPGQPERVSTIFQFRFTEPEPAATKLVDDDPLLGLSGILAGAIPEGAHAFLEQLRMDRESQPTQ